MMMMMMMMMTKMRLSYVQGNIQAVANRNCAREKEDEQSPLQ